MAFFCSLCSKGYARMNEYEAHLSSYDHSHRQRMKDMRAMVRDPTASARARRQEARADGLVKVQLDGDLEATGDGAGDGSAGASSGAARTAPASVAGPGFKKGGFKKSGFKTSGFVSTGGGGAGTAQGPAADEGGGSNNSKAMDVDVVPEPKAAKRATLAATGAFSAPVPLPRSDREFVESDTDDEGYDIYDPRKPTD